jgi:hypothetical protein
MTGRTSSGLVRPSYRTSLNSGERRLCARGIHLLMMPTYSKVPSIVYGRLMQGSCGVEYTLMLTSVGQNRYVYGNKDQTRYTTSQRPPTQVSFAWVSTLVRWIKGLVVGFFSLIKRSIVGFLNLLIDYPLLLLATIWACYKIYQWTVAPVMRWFSGNRRAPRRPPRPWWSSFFGGGGPGGGGGGGGNDPRGPPPPYTYYPPGSRKTYHVPPETQVPRPGFWTGFASGGAAGYGLGRSSATRTQQQQQQQQQQPPQPPTGTRTQAEPSGWFWNVNASNRGSTEESGNNDGGTTDRSSGSGTHTSTGFGGTRRR